MGPRSWDFIFFWTSICETRTAGETPATGYAPGLGAADAVKGSQAIVGSGDLAERGQGGANEVHATHQFLPPVGMDSIHHDRQDVEGIGSGPSGAGESPLDVFEVEPKGLAGLFHQGRSSGPRVPRWTAARSPRRTDWTGAPPATVPPACGRVHWNGRTPRPESGTSGSSSGRRSR